MSNESKCPVNHGARPTLAGAPSNANWWPNQLNLTILHQHSAKSDPMGTSFNYAEAFKSLDLDAVVKDLPALMTDSPDWWPAYFGHFGTVLHVKAWPTAGPYRHSGRRGWFGPSDPPGPPALRG